MSVARRVLPSDPADFLRSIVPLALLAVGALQTDTRWIIVALLALGAGIATNRAAPVRWAWAGAIPAAVAMAVGDSYLGGWPTSQCADPSNGIASTELIRAAAVLGTVFVLALVLHADRASLYVRMPTRAFRPWIPIGLAAGFVVGLIVIHWAFRGTLAGAFDAAEFVPAGLLIAVIVGSAQGITFELALRGALLAWSAKVIGVLPAVVGQAVIAAIAGQGLPIPLEPAWIAGAAIALLAGAIAARTRSLAVTAAVHVGVSVAWYLVLVCDW